VRGTGTDENITPHAVSAMLRKSGPIVKAVGAPMRLKRKATAMAMAKRIARPCGRRAR
jgi:hypothetical protein